MYEGAKRFPAVWNFCNRTALLLNAIDEVLRPLFIMMKIMSEKTKLDQQASGEPNEQVPEWLASQLRRLNDQVMQEKIPEDLLVLLKQIESNERNR